MDVTTRAPNTAMLAAFAVSLLAHASPQLPSLVRRFGPEPVTLASGPVPTLARIDFRAARMELVARARKDRQQQNLALGAFLLDAAAIDAAEAGIPLDHERAANEYESRLKRLRALLKRGSDIQRAFSQVFGDMHYRGIVGGTMAEALLVGGGSCEPLSHLIASALHDAGYAEQAYIRRYGGGVGHLAPIYLFSGSEHDIVRGGPAFPGGVRFAAADLVEIYAIAHGLVGKPERDPVRNGTVPENLPASALSLHAGYPPNADPYPGSVPLYSERALASPGVPNAMRTAPMPWPCTSSGASLFPGRVAMLAPMPYEVEVFELQNRRAVGDLARAVSFWEAEDPSQKSPAQRLQWSACLALVYQELADGFAAWSFRELSSIAADNSERWRRKAVAITERADRKQLARELATLHESWIVLAIEQADDLLFAALPSTAESESSADRIELGAALLSHERTRARALEEASRMSFSDQWTIAGMMRFYAEGDGHPSFGAVHLGDGTELARGFQVFSALLDRLDALRTQPHEGGRRALLRWVRERVGPTWAEGVRERLNELAAVP